ncbi:family 10 glycosylhydrolase [Roseateles sp. DAIF2]|uniref:glycoside hydrolase family 10 protein n=1 Tax=Roseateles sp. DAIF2 TaxID=2714952 RepID=UPI0018A2ABE3|nr:family 10 glycosylhydrolase [Roseateles sp. DAIF2]QPF71812.1 family 10 glycosylhydrolase [Roseateles sp. DAIF2]
MQRRSVLTLAASAAALAACSSRAPLLPRPLGRSAPELAEAAPPAPREFRAAWVATVANIDWPSKPGLSAAQQQAEMRAILDRAVSLKLNAVVFQIRTSTDALYDSRLEPWSEYLSGRQGQSPGYDPLALWITEAHQRGLELHAWFNPFRARQNSAKSPAAANHLSQTHPDWVKSYGDQQWLDPGEPGAAEHTLAVFRDVLQRYDVDGIHIDDYFYPYPIPQPGSDPTAKLELDFPDEPSWQRYLQGGGKLGRHDWRRQNVDEMIRRLHQLILATKPWVRFGISPFGLPKPALRPEGITGFSQYDKLYADVERWLHEGWLDYLVPQLYWPRAQKAQAFAPLLDYWQAQNKQGRHVWAGLFTSRVTPADKAESWPIEEIGAQIEITRQAYPGSGHVHFSMVALMQNRRGLADALQRGLYQQEALVPATPWLEAGGPAAPQAELQEADAGRLRLRLAAGPGKPVLRYALWQRRGQVWSFSTTQQPELLLERQGLDGLVVSALDRVGNEGPRVGLQLSE